MQFGKENKTINNSQDCAVFWHQLRIQMLRAKTMIVANNGRWNHHSTFEMYLFSGRGVYFHLFFWQRYYTYNLVYSIWHLYHYYNSVLLTFTIERSEHIQTLWSLPLILFCRKAYVPVVNLNIQLHTVSFNLIARVLSYIF